MKKILAWILLLALVVGLFAGCGCQKEPDPTEASTSAPTQGAEAAAEINDVIDYLKTIYKDEGAKTPVDYERFGIVRIAGIPFEVVWTVDVSEDLIKIVVNDDGTVTIDVNEKCDKDTPYVLTATVTAEDGTTASYSWNYILPQAVDMVAIVEAAYALAPGESLPYESTLTGKIISINTPYSAEYQNITVTIEVEGAEGKPIQCYRLKGEGIEDLAIGDTITVTGTLKNYNGTIEFDAGCILDSVVPGERVQAPDDPKEIVKAAYALGANESLPYEATLTGTITKVGTPYDANYGNITVTMVIDGMESYPIVCYRLKGDGVDKIGVNDEITVKGYITNYVGTSGYSTIEFTSGCQLLSWTDKAAPVAPTDPKQIVDEAYALAPGASLKYEATLTGKITKVNTPYDYAYDNVTVTIVVEGREDKPIKCYRMKGTGNSKIGVGDTITVRGYIVNYQHSSGDTEVEFNAGCVMLSWQDTGVDKELPEIGVVKGPLEAGVAYKMYLAQKNVGKVLYFNGEISGSYLSTSIKVSESVDVFVEETNGGVYFYFKNGDTKTYINATSYEDSEGDTKAKFSLSNEPSTVFTYDSTTGCYLVSFGEEKFFAGTYNDYETFSLSGTYYIEGDKAANIGTSQFVALFVKSSDAPTVDVEEEVDPNADPDGTVLTIEQAVTKGTAMSHNTYTKTKYKVTGVITEVYNTTHGNMYITDGNGNTLTLYGTYDATGANRYDAMTTKPVAGDTITIYGVLGQYNGTAQIKNGWIVAHTPGSGGNPDVPDVPDVPELPTVSALETGDKVVIFAPAYNKALSADKVNETSFYNKGVNVTVADGALTGYGDAEIWTVTKNEDGTYSFANGGQNIGMADSYSSMNLGETHDDWKLESLGGSLYNVLNTGRSTYLEWYSDKDNWSTYNSSYAATDDQFQISFYVIDEGILSETTTPDTPDTPDVPDTPVESSAELNLSDVANRTSYTTAEQNWEQNGIKLTNVKGSSTSNIGDYVPARFYKNSDVTIECAGMTKLVFDTTGIGSSYVTNLHDSLTAVEGITVTKEDSAITVELPEAADSFTFTLTVGQGRAAKLIVYKTESTPDTPDVPAIVDIATALKGENNTEFKVKGVITMVDGKNVYIQDSTGGICIFFDVAPSDLALGETIEASGTRAEYNGLPELTGASYLETTGEALTAKETAISALTTDDICTYVKITGLEVTEVSTGSSGKPDITVKDTAGNTIKIYKAVVEGTVEVGDSIDLTAAVGVYNTTLQLRNTLATEITVTSGGESGGEGGNQNPGSTDTFAYDFSTFSGTSVQYAQETHDLGSGVTLEITSCHINTQLRIYSSSTNNGVAILKTAKPIAAIKFNAGNKDDTLNVYGSVDGINWTLVKGEAVTSSYADHTVEMPEGAGYQYLKLDVEGTQQIRIKTIAITFATETVAKEDLVYDFATFSGTSVQYAQETHDLGSDVTLEIKDCHINGQLRIYSNSSNNGAAIFKSVDVIKSIKMNVGNKADVLNVYGSVDGETWTLVKAEEVTSAYADHTIEMPAGAGYKFLKLDVEGTQQIRVKNITISFGA